MNLNAKVFGMGTSVAGMKCFAFPYFTSKSDMHDPI